MNVGYVNWTSLGLIILPFIYVSFVRDIYLKKKFKDLLGEDETFIQWFQEEGCFPILKIYECGGRKYNHREELYGTL